MHAKVPPSRVHHDHEQVYLQFAYANIRTCACAHGISTSNLQREGTLSLYKINHADMRADMRICGYPYPPRTLLGTSWHGV